MNSLSDVKECYDPETASSIGATHVVQETGVVLDSQTKTQYITGNQKVVQSSEVDPVSTNTHILLKLNLNYIFLKTMKL